MNVLNTFDLPTSFSDHGRATAMSRRRRERRRRLIRRAIFDWTRDPDFGRESETHLQGATR